MVLWNEIIIEQNFIWRFVLYPVIKQNEFIMISSMSLGYEIKSSGQSRERNDVFLF
jgi:hypothetical protein